MQTAFPSTLVQPSLGQRLRARRLAQQKSVNDVAAQLKLPTIIVEAMECDDHSQLGAAVFARGRLSGHARLVGVPVDAVESQFAHALVTPPALVSSAYGSPVERALHRLSWRTIYIVPTATVALMVSWLATHNQSPQSTIPLAVLDGMSIAWRNAVPAATQSGNHALAREAGKIPSAVASTAPLRSDWWMNGEGAAATVTTAGTTSTAVNNALQLRFSGDSWVEIVGVDGRVIKHDTVEAGNVRNSRTAAIASVEIGSPSAVLVLRNGRQLDLKPFQGANQTRFTLSSDGEPAPSRD